MNDLELIFSILGEAATTEITRTKDVKGFNESKTVAKQDGDVARSAREDLEQKSNKKVSTSGNYLKETQSKKRLK